MCSTSLPSIALMPDVRAVARLARSGGNVSPSSGPELASKTNARSYNERVIALAVSGDEQRADDGSGEIRAGSFLPFSIKSWSRRFEDASGFANHRDQ